MAMSPGLLTHKSDTRKSWLIVRINYKYNNHNMFMTCFSQSLKLVFYKIAGPLLALSLTNLSLSVPNGSVSDLSVSDQESGR